MVSEVTDNSKPIATENALLKEYETKIAYVTKLADRFWQIIVGYTALQAASFATLSKGAVYSPLVCFNVLVSLFCCLWIFEAKKRRAHNICRVNNIAGTLGIHGYYSEPKLFRFNSLSMWFCVVLLVMAVVWITHF